MRSFTIITEGREVKYQGWDRRMNPCPRHIALVQDDDCIDILALDDPTKLAGVLAYLDDSPHAYLIGVWQNKPSTTKDPISDDRLANFLNVPNPQATKINNFLQMCLSQEDYDRLIEMLG